MFKTICILTVLTTPHLAAASPFEDAYDYCWAQQAAFIEEGVAMPTTPIAVTGQTWTVTWPAGHTDTIAGDTITTSFDGDVAMVSGQTFAMADHVLTIAHNRKEGRKPFMVRYEGTLFMIVPYPETTDAEPWCLSLPVS